ncbi:MAG: hypothetical protein EOO20_15285 [Chryseobacterium sp.]|nr:MAG: hypothetical protein EOO20_15285 [Chryseobacterium sp.]
MNYEKQIKVLLDGFAGALNSADSESLPTYFAANAQFMPEGRNTITKLSDLTNSSKYLKDNFFKIGYTIENLEIDGDFAFVSAVASTSQIEVASKLAVNKTSRDLFVLKKISEDWKIYRYMFNNVK